MGRPSFEVYPSEIALIVAELALTRKKLRSWTKPERVPTALVCQPGRSWIYREPLGVVLIIGPWNYPLQLLLLAAGRSDRGRQLRGRQAERAGAGHQQLDRHAAAGIRRLRHACRSSRAGSPRRPRLLAERFDHIFYTGGETVGRIVMEAAAKHLTPVTLELGGKSPCIVDRQTDLDVAARRIVWGKFYNAGQTCVAPDYVLAHKEIEEPLLAQMKQTLHEFFGDDPHPCADFGRIVNARHYRAADEAAAGQRRDRHRRHRLAGRPLHRADDPPQRPERRPRHGRARSSGRSCRCSASRTSTRRSPS